jgi:hypothetical protein
MAAECRPMHYNTSQYNRYSIQEPTPYSTDTSMISNTPHYNKNVLQILKPHSIHFMN